MITASEFLKYLEVFNVQWGGSSGPITIPVPINQGGTSAITAAAARTNLGLGTIATQSAASVAITGGSATFGILRAGFVYTNLVGNASLTASQTNEAFNMTVAAINLDGDLGIAAFATGFQFNVKNTSVGNCTFTPKLGETIDGAASLTIHPGEAYTIMRATTEWVIIGSTFGLLGDPIPLSEGGTGANLTASVGGIVYSDATSMQILAGTATAGLPLLSGSSAAPTWGAFALSLGGTLTTAGAFEMVGAFTFTGTLTGNTGVTFPTTGTLATLGDIPSVTPSALTKTDDTNVTLTLGGTPNSALLAATSLTLGWTGTLAITRGGTGAGDASGARTNLGAAASGANADITSMTGLTGTLRAPTGVSSSAGVDLLKFNYIPSAVNYIEVFNNVTANAPSLISNGTDAAVGFAFQSKNGFFDFLDWTGTVPGTIRLKNANNTQYIGLTVPSALGASTTFTLPSADGSSGFFLQTNGSGVWSFVSQKVVQQVVSQTSAVATGTTQIPFDDTVPQNTEGDQYLTVSITPKNAANQIKIEVLVNCAHSAGTAMTAAVFRNSETDAILAGVCVLSGANNTGQIKAVAEYTAGGTSSQTFNVRVGCTNAGTTTVNGSAGARLMAGALASSIIITEYTP